MRTAAQTKYTVDVHREDNKWIAIVAEVRAAATEVDDFAELDTEVRDLVSGLQDREPDSFELEWRFSQGGRDYTESVNALQHWEAETAQALANRDRARLEIITTLRDWGMSQRAIAEVVGTSHQRVAQLLAGAA